MDKLEKATWDRIFQQVLQGKKYEIGLFCQKRKRLIEMEGTNYSRQILDFLPSVNPQVEKFCNLIIPALDAFPKELGITHFGIMHGKNRVTIPLGHKRNLYAQVRIGGTLSVTSFDAAEEGTTPSAIIRPKSVV